MGAERARQHGNGFAGLVVSDIGNPDRPAGLWIDAARPVHRREVLGGDQFPSLAVEDVEKSILVRLHQDFASGSVDRELREDQLLDRIIIPFLAGRCLVVPYIVPRIGVDRDDRRQEPIVTLACAAIALVPWSPLLTPK